VNDQQSFAAVDAVLQANNLTPADYIAARAELADEAVTIQVAARALGVGLRTMERWVSVGRIPSIRIGACRRIRKSDIQKIIQEGTP